MGKGPTELYKDGNTRVLYVLNTDSNTVSVISTTNNTKIKDIKVGKGPIAMADSAVHHTKYILSQVSHGVSVIDAKSIEVLAGVTFQIQPFNSGYIMCDGINIPTSQYFFISYGTLCTAKTQKGFQFQSWEENLNDKETILVSVSLSDSNNIYGLFEYYITKIAEFFGIPDFLGYHKPVEHATILNVTKFGTFTANFKELPSPIPTEYWLGLLTVVIGSILG